jgi:SulP family sulfate permease
LATGVFFLLLGRFKLSRFIRFIPYPVVGGFLAGTGWLLVRGAVGVMTDNTPSLSSLPALFQTGLLIRWLPGLVFAFVLLLVLRRHNHFLIMPAILLGAIGLFYGVLLVTHTPVPAAAAQGWLLGPFPANSLWQPLTPAVLSQVNWPAIFGELDKLGAILVISAIALLLNISALEVTVQRDIDMDRELQAAGLANLLAGLGGSPVGYQALSLSTLAYRLNARSRLVNLVSALMCGLALFFGAALLSILPKPVLGGLLMFLGLSFLVEWVYDAWFRLSRVDYVLVLLILVVVSTLGFLQGVAVGVAVAVILFVVNYSRINVIKNTLSGASYHSNVDRPAAQRQLLEKQGDRIFILGLQGFIFFGTAQLLLSRIHARLNTRGRATLAYLVLDFRLVSGLDSSAVFSFVRMQQLAEVDHFHLILTDLRPADRRQLEKGGLAGVLIFPALDYGVEWCEDDLLAAEGANLAGRHESLQKQLKQVLSGPAAVTRLMAYLEKQEVGEGHTLMHQGDPPEAMYFIESGQVKAELELPDGKTMRLRTMHSGSVVGEIGLYLGGARTASIITTQPSTLYRLSAAALEKMNADDPQVAMGLHQWIARLLAERLSYTNRTLEALME